MAKLQWSYTFLPPTWTDGTGVVRSFFLQHRMATDMLSLGENGTLRDLAAFREATRRWCLDQWGEPGSDNLPEYTYAVWGNAESAYMTIAIRDASMAFEFKLNWC